MDNDNKTKGKLIRCFFEPPTDQKEFPFMMREDGTIVANLENYAIIPISKWESLTGRQFTQETYNGWILFTKTTKTTEGGTS